jgi:hypothetical protein
MAIAADTNKRQYPSTRIKIEIDEAEFKRVQSLLMSVPNGARIALSTAINKTLRTERSAISKRIAATMTAKKSSTDKRIKVRPSTRSNLYGFIRIRGDIGVSLAGFFAQQTATGVTVKIFGKTSSVPHAWIGRGLATTKSEGAKAVFQRDGEKRAMKKGMYGPASIFGYYSRGPRKGQRILRQPIEVLYGPSVAETFRKTPGMQEGSITDINTNLRKNVASQIDWLLRKGLPNTEAGRAA